jgi:hypothetical protein
MLYIVMSACFQRHLIDLGVSFGERLLCTPIESLGEIKLLTFLYYILGLLYFHIANEIIICHSFKTIEFWTSTDVKPM